MAKEQENEKLKEKCSTLQATQGGLIFFSSDYVMLYLFFSPTCFQLNDMLKVFTDLCANHRHSFVS